MKTSFRRIAIVLLTLLILSPIGFEIHAADLGDALPAEMIRVGLFYGSEARMETQLDTSGNLGYRIGFYDEDRTLHAVGEIGSRSVIVIPNMTASLSTGEIGGVHLRLPARFDSFDAAAENARANDGFPAFCNGEFCVMIGSYPTAEAAQEALNAMDREAEVYADGGRGVLVLPTGSTSPILLFDYSSTHPLVLSPHDSQSKPVTSCGGTQYFGDFLFNRLTSEGLTVVNCVTLEDYVKGILPNEMSSAWPTEALKAQAVCARTYALKNLNGYRIYGFDVADDTTSQVYRGLRDADTSTDEACDATAGQVLRSEGSLCSVYYFAADGGITEDSEYVWNDVVIPYLRAVSDPYESEIDFYCKSWTAAVSHAAVGDLFVEYSPNGTVRSVSYGDQVFHGDAVRDFLVLIGAPYNSRKFTVSYDADSDVYVITGGGSGHNLGMSQWGAYSMANNHGMRYQDILSFYFSGATIS